MINFLAHFCSHGKHCSYLGWFKYRMRSLRFVLSVAAGAGEVVEFPGFNSINYMQEMTQPICYHAEVGETKQLIDSRDNKYYWVTKLKDGNCWMTQNLDFDIPDTLYSTTSNVGSASVSTGTTKATAPSNWPANNDNPNYNGYYDPGDYIYNGPSNNHSQDTTNSCTNITDGLNNSECNLFATTVANTSTQVLGDANSHYHVGNYYSWPAATVKSGDSLTTQGTSAPDSICPKGWGLPTSGRSAGNTLLTEGKTFAKLFEAYNWTWNRGSYTNTLNGGTSYYIYNAPFYFTYGGYLNSSTLNNAGDYGDYWSSTVISGTGAFALYFYSGVLPADSSVRYLGFSVRCVAE